MRAVYFKHRNLFDFKSEFDIGHAIPWNKQVEDNHFLYRVYNLTVEALPEFYYHHLRYFLSLYNDSEESEFYTHVKRIVEDTIFQLKNKDRYNSDHSVVLKRQRLLEDFLKFIISTDPEGIEKAKDTVISSQKIEILELNKIILDLEKQIREARKNQTTDYLNIAPAHLMTLVDLIYQLQELKIDDKELVFSQTQIIWAKILNEYFRENNEEIKLETIRRYFPADRSRKVPVKNRMFKISLVNEPGKAKQRSASTRISVTANK